MRKLGLGDYVLWLSLPLVWLSIGLAFFAYPAIVLTLGVIIAVVIMTCGDRS